MNKSDLITMLKHRVSMTKEKTQKELAGELGISEQYLSDVLRGRRDPGAAILDGLGLLKDEQTYRWKIGA